MRLPFVHCGSNVGWIARGTSRSCAAANTASWAGWPRGIAVWVNGATNPPRAPSPTARSSSAAAPAGSIERQVRGRDQPAAAVGAPVADPAVVGPAVGLRELGIVELGLPQQPGGGVDHRGVDVLGVEQLQALLGVLGAVRGVVVVGDLGVAGHLRRGRCAPSTPGVEGKPRRDIVDRSPPMLSSSRPFSSFTIRRRAVAVLRLEVGLPQVGGLEDVAVGVDGAIPGQAMGLVHLRSSPHPPACP